MDNKPAPDCITLENDSLRLQVARSFGPRIISLSFRGGSNLLAELPDFVTQRPDGKDYHFYGGHRLWVAPEDPIRSYALDDQPVEIIQSGNSLLVRKPVEAESGIEKSMQVDLAETGASVTITHRLLNPGPDPLECAPWAITQFRMAGVAVLPQGFHRNSLLPDRSLALWPYTNISSPHVSWGNRYILLHAEPQAPFKIGFPNPRGWLGYWLDGVLFFKRVDYKTGEQYIDFGSSSECYCNYHFLELETLAPIGRIAPNASATHTETWQLFGNIASIRDESAVQAILDEVGME
jgi:hypothetical protein